MRLAVLPHPVPGVAVRKSSSASKTINSAKLPGVVLFKMQISHGCGSRPWYPSEHPIFAFTIDYTNYVVITIPKKLPVWSVLTQLPFSIFYTHCLFSFSFPQSSQLAVSPSSPGGLHEPPGRPAWRHALRTTWHKRNQCSAGGPQRRDWDLWSLLFSWKIHWFVIAASEVLKEEPIPSKLTSKSWFTATNVQVTTTTLWSNHAD